MLSAKLKVEHPHVPQATFDRVRQRNKAGARFGVYVQIAGSVSVKGCKDPSFLHFANTLRAAWESFWVPQYCLLGDQEDMHEIVAAVKKIQATAKQLG